MKGKKNNNYKTGLYSGENFKGKGISRQAEKASKEYKQEIFDKKGYLYCEDCLRSNSLRFEVHHIVFRSEAPRHPKLNSKENLILLCRKCHCAYHNQKDLRKKLVEKRNLKTLFNNL